MGVEEEVNGEEVGLCDGGKEGVKAGVEEGIEDGAEEGL